MYKFVLVLDENFGNIKYISTIPPKVTGENKPGPYMQHS